VLPDRAQVTMDKPFLRAYSQLLIKTCHRRGAHAMGGMAAQIPIKNDPAANDAALEKVRADKLREVKRRPRRHVGRPPGPRADRLAIFDEGLAGRVNQLDVARAEFETTAAALVQTPTGPRTEAGLRHNVRVGVQYLEAWLRGQGCVPLYDLMEDAATAEISRSQVWQWLRHGAEVDDERR
jgi:malate synthase